MKKSFYLLIFILLFIFLIPSSNAEDGGHGFAPYVVLKTGMGMFKDIKLPQATYEDLFFVLDDGEKMEKNHFGFPLIFSLGGNIKNEVINYDVNIKLLHLAKTIQSNQSPGVSYERLELKNDLKLYAPIKGFTKPYIGGGVILRRSIFSNISSGHFVNSISPELSFGLNISPALGLKIYGARSLMSSFGYYSSKKLFSNKSLNNSTSKLFEYGIEGKYSIANNSYIYFGAALEQIDINIKNIEAYHTEYGLNIFILPGEDLSKNYHLNTLLFKIGFQKIY